jgi:predicted RNA-binding protein Jag
MKQIFTAATVDEAKNKAAVEFGTEVEKITFTVLEEPKKGFFGKIKGEAVEMIKNCMKCGTPTEFGVSHNSRQGYWCKPCRSKASVESAARHRERKRKNNNAYHARNSSNRAAATSAWRANHPEKRPHTNTFRRHCEMAR